MSLTVVAKSIWEFVHPDDRAIVERHGLFGTTAPHGSLPVGFRIRREDATVVWLEALATQIEHRGQTAKMGNVIDVTARHKAEEEKGNVERQLLHAQKMEAVGRLAGGVAHDFNNLLTCISCSAQLLNARAPGPQQEELATIVEATQKAASLTRQLLAFSRKQVLAPCVLDFNTILDQTERILRRVIGGGVELVVLSGPVVPTYADPSQIEQVVLNLVINASDAMPDGGQLIIEAGEIQADDAIAKAHGIAIGTHATLRVSDSGTGIAAEDLPYIFDPFFTTKEEGKGTGLGLSMVHGIIEQSGGHIEVQSSGEGTRFTVYLPRSEQTAVDDSDPEVDASGQS